MTTDRGMRLDLAYTSRFRRSRFAGSLWLGVSWLLLVSVFPAAIVCGGAQARHLNLFIWSEYIDPSVVSGFEREFHCRVTIDVYEEEESMMAKLLGGGDALYDVIVPSNQLVPALIKLDLLAPLPHAKLPNLKNLEPRFANPPYDPGNRFTVPFQWGTFGIFLRPPNVKAVDQTWGLFFDPRKQPGPFLLIDSYREAIGAALQYAGHSLNSTDVPQLKEARDLLLAAKRRALGFEGSVGNVERVVTGQAVAAMVYNGDAVKRMSEAPGTVYFVPQEGSQIWVDNLAIPSRAPHFALAVKFLNHILDPKVGAQQSNFSRYATPNAASRRFINPADLHNPVIYPPPDVMKRLQFTRELGAKSRLYDEVWTRVRSE